MSVIDRPKTIHWGAESGWRCGVCPGLAYTRFEWQHEFVEPCPSGARAMERFYAAEYDRDDGFSYPIRPCERVVHEPCRFVFCLTHGGRLGARRS